MTDKRGAIHVWPLSLALIFVSACGTRPDLAPVENVYRGPSFYDYAPDSWSAETYTVRPGDTLYSIAFRASMDIREVAKLNNLSEPYRIYPEQVLRLKDSSGSSQVTQKPREAVVTSQQTGYGENSNRAPKNSTEGGSPSVVVSAIEKPTVQPVVKPSITPTVTPSIKPRLPKPVTGERDIASADIKWRWPSSGKLVSRFSTRDGMNRGMEFAGSKGDPVIAAAAGKVVYVGTALRGYGRLIILKHNDDYITAYGHNEEILVREQDWVESGQQIATMGKSGREDVRLRFELRLRGNSVNPENYLPRSR